MVEIRNARPDDRDAIELLTRLLLSEREEIFESKRFEWGILRRLYDPVQRHGIFVAEEMDEQYQHKKIVGMIVAEIRVDPFGFSEGYIKQFFVRPDYRKKGHGALLLQTAIEHFRGMDIEKVKVNVKTSAQDAFLLYSHQNFQPKYTVMELNLKNTPTESCKSDENQTGFDTDSEQ
jgi:ribosomal protein S18 acetylase RimI-like enzyme